MPQQLLANLPVAAKDVLVTLTPSLALAASAEGVEILIDQMAEK